MDSNELCGFTCAHCGMPVSLIAPGTRHRNHCPFCLHSLHVDIKPGDRSCLCRGVMEPVAIWVKSDGEMMILHRCRRCGSIKPNRCAGDDSEELLQEIARRPLKAIS